MNKVLAIFAGAKRPLGGCEIYRVTMPFHYLEQRGHWKADWAFFDDLFAQAQRYGSTYWYHLLTTYDLFVFPRFYTRPEHEGSLKELMSVFRDLGKPVIYEVDDDYTNRYRVVVDGNAMDVARECNAITVTTPYLAQLMKLEAGIEPYVLPNCFAPDAWYPLPRGTFRDESKVTIGLTGSATHAEDWRVLETVLPKVLENDKAHLILMGYHPDYLKDLPNTTYLPGLPYDKYAQIIQRCDIILTPLNEDGFNLGKSPLKAIEGMAARRMVNGHIAGAAVISSDHPVYRLAVQHNKTGIVTPHAADAWLDYIQTLVHDDKFRQQLQIQGHEWVGKHHDISKKWSLWQNAYDAILRKKTPVLTPL